MQKTPTNSIPPTKQSIKTLLVVHPPRFWKLFFKRCCELPRDWKSHKGEQVYGFSKWCCKILLFSHIQDMQTYTKTFPPTQFSLVASHPFFHWSWGNSYMMPVPLLSLTLHYVVLYIRKANSWSEKWFEGIRGYVGNLSFGQQICWVNHWGMLGILRTFLPM